MNVLQLRQLLKEIKETLSSSQSFAKEHDVSMKVREHFKDRKDEDELDDSDVYNLLQLIPFDSNSALFTAIKNEFDQHHLFDIYKSLNEANLIDEGNFPIIYYSSEQERNFLYRLFYNDQFKIKYLHKEQIVLLYMIAERVIRKNYDTLAIEKCICLLSQWSRLSNVLLTMIYTTSKAGGKLLDAFELCNKTDYPAEMLEEYGSYIITQIDSIHDFTKRLTETHIPISKELIAVIISNTQSGFYKPSRLEKFYSSLNKLLEIISNKVTINDTIWAKILRNSRSLTTFYKVIDCLNKENLLNQKSFDQYMNTLFSKENSILNCTNDVSRFIATLEQANVFLNNKFLLSLFLLSAPSFDQLQKTISILSKQSLLNEDSFHRTVERMTEKLAPVTESTMVKKSSKVTKLRRSEIVLDGGRHSFFTDHSDQHEKGSFGDVKKGYPTLTATDPTYSVKKLVKSSSRYYRYNERKDAVREVKYNRLLQRKADYFTTPTPSMINRSHFYHVISEWHSGKDLKKFTTTELTQTNYADRLKCLCNGLSDLNTLHHHYRIHGDIKPANFILDLKLLSMKMIDFGGAIKFGSGKHALHTSFFKDPRNDCNHFYSDIYSMGIVIMTLFPELYKDESPKDQYAPYDAKATFSLLKGRPNLTLIEKAIIQLVASMMNPKTSLRCSSEDALRYCRELLDQLPHLDDALLQKITISTIKRTDVTVEDILREARI